MFRLRLAACGSGRRRGVLASGKRLLNVIHAGDPVCIVARICVTRIRACVTRFEKAASTIAFCGAVGRGSISGKLRIDRGDCGRVILCCLGPGAGKLIRKVKAMTSISAPMPKRVRPRTPEPFACNARLIALCLAGDQTAWNRLIQQCEPLVFSYARSLCRNAEDASDITSHVFLRLFHSLHTYREGHSFRSWLFRIVHNIFIDLYVRNSEHGHLSLDASPVKEQAAYVNWLVDTAGCPETAYLEKEGLQRMVAGMDHLTRRQRQALLLFVQGHSYEEIAMVTGLSMGTVKSRINRARNALSAHLEEEEAFAHGKSRSHCQRRRKGAAR